MKNLNIILFVILCLLLFFRRQTTEKMSNQYVYDPDDYVMYSTDGSIKGEKPVIIVEKYDGLIYFVIKDGVNYKVMRIKENDKQYVGSFFGKNLDLSQMTYDDKYRYRVKRKYKPAPKLIPSDYEMYGPFIGNGPQTIQKMLIEDHRIAFLIKQGPYTKIVKADYNLNNQIGSNYEGEIDDYSRYTYYNPVLNGGYIVRKKGVEEEELIPSDYEMYGPSIGNVPQTIQKIVIEGSRIAFLIKQGPYTKIIKANKDLKHQIGYYYLGRIEDYSSRVYYTFVGSGKYIVRKKLNKDTNPEEAVARKEELNPSDYIMYGNFIGTTPQNIKKIEKKGDKIIFITKHGRYTKIVETDKNLNNQKGYYYVGNVNEYNPNVNYSRVGTNSYIVTKKLDKNDYIMNGPFIGSDKPIQKIFYENDKIVFIIKHGRYTKIVKSNRDLSKQNGYYYTGEISSYSPNTNYSRVGSGGYNVEKK